MGRIVVGVDESAMAVAALRWAVAHATADDRVEAWHAWHPGAGTGAGASPDERALEAATLDAVASVATVTSGAAAAGEVTPVLVRAVAASALIDAGRDADLLVVGGRLGSVSRYVVDHATAPVVVVPPG